MWNGSASGEACSTYDESTGPPRAVHLFRIRHSYGDTGCGSAQKPFRTSRASFSNPSSTESPGAYILYHQHHPPLTNV